MTTSMRIRKDRENLEFRNELTKEQRSALSKTVRDMVAALRTEEYFRERGLRADRAETLRILERAGAFVPRWEATNFHRSGRTSQAGKWRMGEIRPESAGKRKGPLLSSGAARELGIWNVMNLVFRQVPRLAATSSLSLKLFETIPYQPFFPRAVPTAPWARGRGSRPPLPLELHPAWRRLNWQNGACAENSSLQSEYRDYKKRQKGSLSSPRVYAWIYRFSPTEYASTIGALRHSS
jgi:hypothetical protein